MFVAESVSDQFTCYMYCNVYVWGGRSISLGNLTMLITRQGFHYLAVLVNKSTIGGRLYNLVGLRVKWKWLCIFDKPPYVTQIFLECIMHKYGEVVYSNPFWLMKAFHSFYEHRRDIIMNDTNRNFDRSKL